MASSLLELACWCQLDSLLNIFGLASTIDTQYTSNYLQLLSDPADLIFENPTNSACWNFQYKAFIKLCAKTHFIKSLWGDNLVVVTPIYKKLGTIGLLVSWRVQIFCHHLCTLMFSYIASVCLLAAKIIFILVVRPFYGNYLYLAVTFLKKHGIVSLFWEEWQLSQLRKLKYP